MPSSHRKPTPTPDFGAIKPERQGRQRHDQTHKSEDGTRPVCVQTRVHGSGKERERAGDDASANDVDTWAMHKSGLQRSKMGKVGGCAIPGGTRGLTHCRIAVLKIYVNKVHNPRVKNKEQAQPDKIRGDDLTGPVRVLGPA